MAETGGTTPDYSLSATTLAAVREAGVDPKIKGGKATARQALQRGKMVDKVGDAVATSLKDIQKEKERKENLAEEAGIKWDEVFEEMKGNKGWASDELYQDFMADEKEFRAQYIELVESGDKAGAAKMLREQQRRADALGEWKKSMTSAASMSEEYDLSELLIGENNEAGFKRYMLEQLAKNGGKTATMRMGTDGGDLSADGQAQLDNLDQQLEDGKISQKKYDRKKAQIEERFTEETTQGGMVFDITGSPQFEEWFAKEYPNGVSSADVDKIMTSAVSPVIRKEGFEKMTLQIVSAVAENPDTEFDFEKRHKGNTDIYKAELRKNPDAAGSILRDPWAGDNSLMTDLTNAITNPDGGFQFRVELNKNGEKIQGIKVDESVDADINNDGVLSMSEMGLDNRDIETIMNELEKNPEMLATIAGEWTALKQENIHKTEQTKAKNKQYQDLFNKASGTKYLKEMLTPGNAEYNPGFADWYEKQGKGDEEGADESTSTEGND